MKRTLLRLFSMVAILTMVVSFLPAGHASAATAVFFNEIHYDNAGTDSGEAIEVAGPTGTDLTGWSIVLYNGSGGGVYNTASLSGTIPDLGGSGYGVVIISYPANGIQNGSPDGMALVDAGSNVIEFFSYEGNFTAVGGPANGLTSTDIGVSENGFGAVGDSLQLTGTGTTYEDFTWATEAPNTFGAFNTGQSFAGVVVPTDPTGSGAASPSTLAAGDSTLLTVVVTPGTNPTSSSLAVTCDLSAIGGSSSQAFFDDNTHGDATAGDKTFSFKTNVSGGTSVGDYNLQCSISDDYPRSGSASIDLTIASYIPVPDDVVISQVYGGGGNSGATYKNDFIELYNRSGHLISLAGWTVQYGSATGSSWSSKTVLSGSIAAGKYYLIQEAAGAGGTLALPTPDASGTIAMAAGSAKVALVFDSTSLSGSCPSGSTISDLVGYGSANCSETAPTPALSNTTAAIRNGAGSFDTNDNSADFTVGVPTPRNSAFPFGAVGLATPTKLLDGQTTLLTVAVTPGVDPASSGLAVSCDLSPIGGINNQPFYDDGTNGDMTAGDNAFSFATTDTVPGTKNLTCTFTDAQSRQGTTLIPVTLLVVLPIGQVNGPVPDLTDATVHTSPYVGQTVLIQGIIYETTLQAISNSSNTYKGFFIQNTAATADGDTITSDGLFVFMNTSGTMPGPSGPYTPTVGDEVVISGNVSEYYNMTELGSPTLELPALQSGLDIESAVPAVVADPPVSLYDANIYWERLQGMRVQVPQDSVVLGGRNVYSPADAEVWVAAPDSTIAMRSDVYAQKAYRDAHPLDDNYDPSIWDGNGYRILMGSLGIKSLLGDDQALIAPARSYDTLANAPSGGVNYTFSKYRIEISTQAVLREGPDPSADNPLQVFDPSFHYSIADYNMENLYDYRDNPFSGCDFLGDSGCSNAGTPYIAPVNPPYDYVPASDAAYQARLTDIAHQIIDDLHGPDIIMAQEIENQDFCVVSGSALDCGTSDNADGKPDVLQELALKIASLGGPSYDAAFDRDSSDLRGIAPAFLYRTDRVQLLSPVGDPILGSSPAIGSYTAVSYDSDVSNPKTLNAVLPSGITACETNWVFPRAPDIGLFRIFSTSIGMGSHRDVYVIDNHFKSGPDSCVGHRTEQANYNAALVAFLQTANPTARIVVGGDLNVYPRPDDPFAPIGQPSSSDQLGALYDPSLGLQNLWDVLLSQVPKSAYSYVYVGQAQTLDQLLVNQPMLASLEQYRIAHVNSDFPADYPDDVGRGTSDHDPSEATFIMFGWSGFFSPINNPPGMNNVKAGSSVPVKFSLSANHGNNIFATGYPQSVQIQCNTGSPIGSPVPALNPGNSSLSFGGNQYNFVWKTDKSWSGTCRQFILKLIDGTLHYANFQFK